MVWGIVAIGIVFAVVAYVVLQGTRASLAWRKAAAGGDVDVIRRMLEESIGSWGSMKRPKDVPPEVWRGVQSVELVEVAADKARVSCPVESENRLVDGRWAEAGGPLQQGMAVTARLVDMLLYDVPNLRLDGARVDVYTTFRDPDGESQRVCILTTNARREVVREVDWEGSLPAEIVDALGGRYRLSERGAALPIDPDDKAAIPALQDLGTQADR